MRTLRESLLDDFGEQSKDTAKRHAIESWLEENHIIQNRVIYPLKYKINKDYTIDIDDFIYIGEGNFPDFIQFNKCKGKFTVFNSKMTSLHGCPKRVDGEFVCSDNLLTNLKGCPKYVGDNFDCSYNQLKTLEGAPRKVGRIFECQYNEELSSLKGAPEEVSNFDCRFTGIHDFTGGPKKVEDDFLFTMDHIKSFEGAPKEIGGAFICYDKNDVVPAKDKQWAKKNIKCKKFCWNRSEYDKYVTGV